MWVYFCTSVLHMGRVCLYIHLPEFYMHGCVFTCVYMLNRRVFQHVDVFPNAECPQKKSLCACIYCTCVCSTMHAAYKPHLHMYVHVHHCCVHTG